MATIEASIAAALFTRLSALVLNPVLPVAWPNLAFKRPQAAGPPVTPLPYLRANHLPAAPQRVFISGADPHIRRGILQISVVYPAGSGLTPAETAGKVAEHFPADLRMISGQVSVRVTAAPAVAPALRDGGDWIVPVSVPYEAII